MSQQAGWYDDPEDNDKLRYWDGVQWTNHTSPKQKADLDRAGQGQQADQGWGAAPGQQGTGQQGWGGGHGQQGQGGHGQHGGYGQQGGEPSNPYAQQPNPYAGQTGQLPYQGQWQGQQPPGGYPMQTDPRSVTPDGQPLAGWWHRVLARILDGLVLIVVAFVALPVVAPGYLGDLMDWSLSTDEPFAPIPAELVAQQARWALSVGVVGLIYEIAMVTLVGGTVGKLITGLRVRLREEPGKVGWGTSAIRGLIYLGPGLLTQLNTALNFLGLFNLINVLWPLWDSKRQAIHDKAARTNVVRHRR